jgi:hypothetical protein
VSGGPAAALGGPGVLLHLRPADRLAPGLVEVVVGEIVRLPLGAAHERALLVHARLVSRIVVEGRVPQTGELLVAQGVELEELVVGARVVFREPV